jgi:hypothetical protein
MKFFQNSNLELTGDGVTIGDSSGGDADIL